MKQHKQGLAKGALLLSVIILFGGLYLADPSAFYTIWVLMKRGEILEIAAYIRSFGGSSIKSSLSIYNSFVNGTFLVPSSGFS